MSFKQYTIVTLKHLVSSQFVSYDPNNIARVKRVRCNLEGKKGKQINYLYLWIFTHFLPTSFRLHSGHKNTSSNPLLKIKVKKHRFQVAIKKRKQYFFLLKIVKFLITNQMSSESKNWTFYKHGLNVNIPTAILTYKTAALQAKNNYFPLIPFQLRFRFSRATAFEKLFLLRAFQILDLHQKLKSFDDIY